MLKIERLESRLNPSFYTSAEGLITEWSDNGAEMISFRPFEENASGVPLFIVADDTRLYIGAGVGGGPRVQVRNVETLSVQLDFMAGPESSRTGVNIAPKQTLEQLRTPLEQFSSKPDAGNALIVDFVDTVPKYAQRKTLELIASKLSLLDIDVRTSPPDFSPADWAIVKIENAPDINSGIIGQSRIGVFGSSPTVPAVSYVYANVATNNPAMLAQTAVHEFGHLAGLLHSPDPDSVMFQRIGNLQIDFTSEELSVISIKLAE